MCVFSPVRYHSIATLAHNNNQNIQSDDTLERERTLQLINPTIFQTERPSILKH